MVKASFTYFLLLILCMNQTLLGQKVYVGNYNNGTISIFETATNSVTGIVLDPHSTIADTNYIAFTPDGSKAYVLNASDNIISIIDAATDTVTGSIINTHGTSSYYMVITPDGKKGYITNTNNTITIVDIATDTIRGIISSVSLSELFAITITPDGRTVYAISYTPNAIVIIDVATDTITGEVTGTLHKPYYNITITPDGRTGYEGNYNLNTITLFDVATNMVSGTVNDPHSILNYYLFDLKITSDGKIGYVSIYDNTPYTVAVIDIATNTVTQAVADPEATLDEPYFIALSADNKNAYVTNYGNSTISIIDIATNTIIGTVIDDPTIDGPYPIAAQPKLTFSGCKKKNIFLTQTDLINVLTWQPAAITPLTYRLYRDAALTQYVASIPGSVTRYEDHNRKKDSYDTYYLVAMYADNMMVIGTITVTENC